MTSLRSLVFCLIQATHKLVPSVSAKKGGQWAEEWSIVLRPLLWATCTNSGKVYDGVVVAMSMFARGATRRARVADLLVYRPMLIRDGSRTAGALHLTMK